MLFENGDSVSYNNTSVNDFLWLMPLGSRSDAYKKGKLFCLSRSGMANSLLEQLPTGTSEFDPGLSWLVKARGNNSGTMVGVNCQCFSLGGQGQDANFVFKKG